MPPKLEIKHTPSPLSTAQVAAYLERIRYPSYSKDRPLPPPTLDTLSNIVLHHQLNVPFENLSLHYDPGHYIHITEGWLYDRIVVQQKGSYCMGVNTMLLWLLRALGYRAYGVGARVAPPGGSLTGLSHMCLLVSLADDQTSVEELYHVDVGFGPMNPIRPLPLTGEAVPGPNPQVEFHRVLHAPAPISSQNIGTDQDWHMQCRGSPEGEWETRYVFMTSEFFPQDYAAMAHAVNTLPGPRSLFKNNVFMSKLFGFPDFGEGVHGRWTLFGKELKRTIAGQGDVVKTFEFEEDRVASIRDVFGIDIGEDELACIFGRQAALASASV